MLNSQQEVRVLNQKQLSYFIEVYQTCNIQTAADKLYVTRQGVSKVIRALENELRQTLFERSTHGLKPTDFAKAMFPHAKSLLDEWEHTRTRITHVTPKHYVAMTKAMEQAEKNHVDFNAPGAWEHVYEQVMEGAH